MDPHDKKIAERYCGDGKILTYKVLACVKHLNSKVHLGTPSEQKKSLRTKDKYYQLFESRN